MKKIFGLLSLVVALFLFAGCDSREKLYVLSWGGYISEDLIEAFEEEYNVKVVVSEATSNESMHNKIKTKAGKYDIVIPSDYMVEKMHLDGLLVKLDFSKIPNYNKDKIDPNLQILRDYYFSGNQDYSVPYFWGSLGIMYNESKAGLKEIVEEYEWRVFFDRTVVPNNVLVGMYDSSRDAVACAQLYLGYSLNSTNDTELQNVENALKGFNYKMWGTDDLKDNIASRNLDVALVYSGDYFDTLYFALETNSSVTFNMHVPTSSNNIWFDTMVIPTTSQNVDLAHEFINFFLDIDNAIENAMAIGYCPTMTEVYEAMINDEEMAPIVSHPGYYPGNIYGEVYRHLGDTIARRFDEILTRAKTK